MKITVKASTTNYPTYAVSFDFINDGEYDYSELGTFLMNAIDETGVECLGCDFRDVDYSSYPEYRDEIIAQGKIDFRWDPNYAGYDEYSSNEYYEMQEGSIEAALEMALEQFGYKLIGMDFYLLEDDMKRYIRSSEYSKGGTGNPDEWDSTVIRRSGEPKLARKIYQGLQWDVNGHMFEIDRLNRANNTAVVTEDWISEDTGREIHQEETWRIVTDNRSEFVCPVDNVNYRLHAIDADNSAEVRDYEDSFAEYDDPETQFKKYFDDEYEEMDEDDIESMYAYYNPGYIPKEDRDNRSYSPSRPWDAPGMSIKDFI